MREFKNIGRPMFGICNYAFDILLVRKYYVTEYT